MPEGSVGMFRCPHFRRLAGIAGPRNRGLKEKPGRARVEGKAVPPEVGGM